MPIYEYRCDSCGHEFEVIQKITEDPVGTCESCDKHQVKRLISHTSFQLKGGGWYADLYGSSSGHSKSAASSNATPSSTGAGSSSSESKSSPSSSSSNSSSSSSSSASSSKKS